MDRDEFLELFAECVKEGLISFEYHKSTIYYDYDRVDVRVNGEVVKQIGLY